MGRWDKAATAMERELRGRAEAGAAMPPLPFDETIYGIAKRARVFREWVEAVRARRAGGRLAILDYGCGTGDWLTLPLAHAGDLVHGVDVHPPSIVAAQARHSRPNVRFSCVSMHELLAAGERYDVIICSEVLEHLPDPGTHLAAFRRVLHPGGELFVTVPNGYGPFETLRRVERALDRLGLGYAIDCALWVPRAIKWWWQGRGRPPAPGTVLHALEATGYLNFESGHVQFFRLADIEGLFAQAGFDLVARRGLMFLCGPYVDFWARYLPFQGCLYALNNHLGDTLPLAWVSDWMFRVRALDEPPPA